MVGRFRLFLLKNQPIKSTWEAYLLQCSKILMDLLIEQNRELLMQTKTKKRDFKVKLQAFHMDIFLVPFQAKLKDMI